MKKYIFSLLFLSVNFLAPFRLSAQPGQQLDHQKNYNYCMHGYSGCDSFSLTDAERTQVQQAARQRNYNSCVHGYAGCDSSQLTDAERTQEGGKSAEIRIAPAKLQQLSAWIRQLRFIPAD